MSEKVDEQDESLDSLDPFHRKDGYDPDHLDPLEEEMQED